MTELLVSAPGDRTFAQWSGRVGVLTAREVPPDDPAMIQARSSMSWWQCRRLLYAEVERGTMSLEKADAVLDRLAQA
jgi:hypothetical protein